MRRIKRGKTEEGRREGAVSGKVQQIHATPALFQRSVIVMESWKQNLK